MQFFIVFITMLSLQKENRLKSLDEYSYVLKCKHKENDLYGGLQCFFLSPRIYFKTKQNNQNQKKPRIAELETISCYLILR